MDWNAFLDGFVVVTQPTNLLYCLIGVMIGMLIGVLPGLGPAATMATSVSPVSTRGRVRRACLYTRGAHGYRADYASACANCSRSM